MKMIMQNDLDVGITLSDIRVDSAYLVGRFPTSGGESFTDCIAYVCRLPKDIKVVNFDFIATKLPYKTVSFSVIGIKKKIDEWREYSQTHHIVHGKNTIDFSKAEEQIIKSSDFLKREIKFRGKRLDTGDWVYGLLFQHRLTPLTFETFIFQPFITPGSYSNFKKEKSETGDEYFRVHPETIGQFTGLYDLHKKEIFEDDIILFQRYANWVSDERHRARVIFSEGCFCWKIIKEGRNSHYNHAYDVDVLNKTKDCWGLEVIGNVSDNPELSQI
jgi:uncharacterized phage protein (TIGR01671 family)